jgi:hypothetical protein
VIRHCFAIIFCFLCHSQSRVREGLVNLLTTCGQRVGLPKSPSVSAKISLKGGRVVQFSLSEIKFCKLMGLLKFFQLFVVFRRHELYIWQSLLKENYLGACDCIKSSSHVYIWKMTKIVDFNLPEIVLGWLFELSYSQQGNQNKTCRMLCRFPRNANEALRAGSVTNLHF